MADSIPAPVLILIGALIALISFILTLTGAKLIVFVIAGSLIFAYGVFKLVRPAPAKRLHDSHRSHHQADMRCHSCGVLIHPKQNFCAHCGVRLK